VTRCFPELGQSTAAVLRSCVGAGVLLVALSAVPVQGQESGFQGASVEWQDRYDSASSSTRLTASHIPLLSPQTLQATEAALQIYTDIESRGGWPIVSADQTIKLGTRSPNVVTLRQRLIVSGDLPANTGMSDTFDSYVETAVRRFQTRHGIIITGAVDSPTLQALNVSASARRRQLEINIERLRAMSKVAISSRFVMVNIPGAEVEAVEGGLVSTRHAAVVGKIDRPSPIQSVRILDINFNPFWTVPASIIRKDLIPKMQANPQYLTENKIRIFTHAGAELQPEQVNWNSMEATNYMFKQDPGDLNSMGTVRINMPNRESVYMHDTPSKGLFGENARFHSSGCVRVQNVRELVEFLLRANGGWSRQHIDSAIRSGERADVKLVEAVPVHWVYMTAWSTVDGVIEFRDDIYNRDGIGELAAVQ
jgi:murein L,D-transpeptidase YcbB/YkuD